MGRNTRFYPGFHCPTLVYTKIQHARDQKSGVAPADEVDPGWWVGGRYSHELGRRWAGTIEAWTYWSELNCIEAFEHVSFGWFFLKVPTSQDSTIASLGTRFYFLNVFLNASIGSKFNVTDFLLTSIGTHPSKQLWSHPR